MRTIWGVKPIGVSLMLIVLAWSGALRGEEATDSDAVDTTEAPTNIATLEGKPRWEFGVGGGYFDGFDYPGSTDSNARQLALPFFIYRSERYRFGGGGLSAVSIEKPRLRFDWSLGASLNSSSEGNSVRAGMEDLDFLIELGPQLVYRIADTQTPNGLPYRLDWRTKLRGVLSTDFGSAKDRGVVFQSSLDGRLRGGGFLSRVDFIGSFRVTAASERLHDYFYEVREQFVTDIRPAYDAQGGLLDINLTGGLALRLPKRFRLFIAASTGFFQSSANRDSPLHRAKQSTSLAIGFAWTIAQSQERVGVLESD